MENRKFYKVTFICATEQDVTHKKISKFIKTVLQKYFMADPAKIEVKQLENPVK